jgi:hypothetical protein
VTPSIERGRNVYSLFTDIAAQTKRTMDVKLSGVVQLHRGWYEVEVRHQPTLNADRVHVSVDVPPGWRVDRAPQMERPFAQRATTTLDLQRTIKLRVHVVPDLDTFDVWNRLKAGA